MIKTEIIKKRYLKYFDYIRNIDRLRPFKQLGEKEAEEEWWVDILFTLKCSLEVPVYITNREQYGVLMEKDENTTKNKKVVDLFLLRENNYVWKKNYYSSQFFEWFCREKKDGEDSVENHFLPFKSSPGAKPSPFFYWNILNQKFFDDIHQQFDGLINANVGEWQKNFILIFILFLFLF